MRSQPRIETDNSALNDIELFCRKPGGSSTWTIKSHYMIWGNWGSDTYCRGANNPVVGFIVREDQWNSTKTDDRTAINTVLLHCQDGERISGEVNTLWGTWQSWQMCPAGLAVRGIRTQVQTDQGDGDDTALNGLELYCSPYQSGRCDAQILTFETDFK